MADQAMTPGEFSALSAYIERACGIHLAPEKAYLIETRLTKLMVLSGCENFGEFHRLAESGKDPSLPEKIINAMTTNETLWFRDEHPFKILVDKVLSSLAERLLRGEASRVRIWSAAAATGQEPYSLAMSVHEFCERERRVKPSQFEIVGTDISSAALTIAKAGRYDGLAITRGLPDAMKLKYFQQDGRVWQLKPEILSSVDFRRFNLQHSPAELGRFDVIFARYVLIYFTDELKRKIIDGFATQLNPRGCLFLGGTESLRGLSERFRLENHAGGAYYCKEG